MPDTKLGLYFKLLHADDAPVHCLLSLREKKGIDTTQDISPHAL